MVTLVLLVYCVILVALSLLGGWLPSLWQWTHIRIQMVMSLIAGFMLGIAFVQLLPHSFQILNNATTVGLTMLCGLLTMFFMIRIFDFHHHHFPGTDGEDHACQHTHHHHHHPASAASPDDSHVVLHAADEYSVGDQPHDSDNQHQHSEACRHEEPVASSLVCAHDHAPSEHQHLTQQSLAWLGLLLGLGLHSIMDGVALAASIQAESYQQHALLAGIGIFLAIAFHKPLDAMSISSVMSVSGWDSRQQFWVNIVFALSCPLAALAVFFGVSWFPTDSTIALGYALAFSAGTFLCISLGDLLPELHFHTHDRFKLSLALLVGIALAVMFEFLPLHRH